METSVRFHAKSRGFVSRMHSKQSREEKWYLRPNYCLAFRSRVGQMGLSNRLTTLHGQLHAKGSQYEERYFTTALRWEKVGIASPFQNNLVMRIKIGDLMCAEIIASWKKMHVHYLKCNWYNNSLMWNVSGKMYSKTIKWFFLKKR